MKETTSTQLQQGYAFSRTMDYVIQSGPVKLKCTQRPDIVIVSANDYEDMKLKCDSMNWISVEDKLPDDESGYKVLVMANDIVGQWHKILNYNGKLWVFDGGKEYPAIVTHWMPLPKPPTHKED